MRGGEGYSVNVLPKFPSLEDFEEKKQLNNDILENIGGESDKLNSQENNFSPKYTQEDVDDAVRQGIYLAVEEEKKKYININKEKNEMYIDDLINKIKIIDVDINKKIDSTVGDLSMYLIDLIISLIPNFNMNILNNEIKKIINIVKLKIKEEINVDIFVNKNIYELIKENDNFLNLDNKKYIRLSVSDSMEVGDVRINWDNGSICRNLNDDCRKIIMSLNACQGVA